MTEENQMMAFGPVPSRRLGKSIGINNIPPKICTYSCVYCQLGRTLTLRAERKPFYKPEALLEAVKKKIQGAQENEESIDYLTFVPDGEPTLDIHLGREIEMLQKLGFKIAVITNASLIWDPDVQKDLKKADWVSLKIDAVDKETWKKVNRAHGDLEFDKILDGILEFSSLFKGDLTTETMLVQELNDQTEKLEQDADFMAGLNTKISYISIPTRPPAENWVKPASEFSINSAYQIFKKKDIDVEYLIGYEGNAFAYTGDVEKDLLSITSVHPMRKEAVDNFLTKAKKDWNVVDKLVKENKLIEIQYKDNKYYMRKLPAKT
jgi:wyosine [tRNA(Phe)-imidazoG37] synthetase (radical SAM superfamily)